MFVRLYKGHWIKGFLFCKWCLYYTCIPCKHCEFMTLFCFKIKSFADTDLSTGRIYRKGSWGGGVVQMVADQILGSSLTIWIISRHLRNKQKEHWIKMNHFSCKYNLLCAKFVIAWDRMLTNMIEYWIVTQKLAPGSYNFTDFTNIYSCIHFGD